MVGFITKASAACVDSATSARGIQEERRGDRGPANAHSDLAHRHTVVFFLVITYEVSHVSRLSHQAGLNCCS